MPSLRRAEELYPAPQLTDTEWSYFAGILDGEGTIRVVRGNDSVRRHAGWSTRYAGAISIVNTSEPLIRWIQERFGGTPHLIKAHGPLSKLPIWDWKIQGRRTVTILKSVLPYLVIKRSRASLVIRLYSEGSWGHGGSRLRTCTSAAEMARRDALYQESRARRTEGK